MVDCVAGGVIDVEEDVCIDGFSFITVGMGLEVSVTGSGTFWDHAVGAG